MRSTRYSVVFLGHGGCLQLLITYAPYYTWASCASQGVSHSHRASGGRQEGCEERRRPSTWTTKL